MTNDREHLWDMVEELIELANRHSEDRDPGLVAEALLRAASRFNAHVVAASSLDRKAFMEDREAILGDYAGQFHHLFDSDLRDYAEHYKVYIARYRDDENPLPNEPDSGL